MTVLFNVPGFWELRHEMIDDTAEFLSSYSHLPHSKYSNQKQLNGTLLAVVVPTPLRHHKVYRDLYKLTGELLIFKVTPWVTFLVTFLILQSKIRYIFLLFKKKSANHVEQAFFHRFSLSLSTELKGI